MENENYENEEFSTEVTSTEEASTEETSNTSENVNSDSEDISTSSGSEEHSESDPDEVEESEDDFEEDYLKKIYELLTEGKEDEEIEVENSQNVTQDISSYEDITNYSALIYDLLIDERAYNSIQQDFWNKPIVEYTVLEGVSLSIFLILLFSVFIKAIKEAIWKWK